MKSISDRSKSLGFLHSTRRQFLVHCSTFVAVASTGPGTLWGGQTQLPERVLDQLTLKHFAAVVNTRFTSWDDSGAAVPLELVEARGQQEPRSVPAVAGDAGHEKFSLLFRGAMQQPLAQNTRWIEHGDIGRFALFIAPVGKADSRHRYYEAVFNRPYRAATEGPQPESHPAA